MKKILLAVLFASTHLYAADDYPTCDPTASDSVTSCPVCFAPGDAEIEDAPEDQQVVCVESPDAG